MRSGRGLSTPACSASRVYAGIALIRLPRAAWGQPRQDPADVNNHIGVGLFVAASVAAFAPSAFAEPPPITPTSSEHQKAIGNTAPRAPTADDTQSSQVALEMRESLTPPPPTDHFFLQFGVALAAEALVSPGDICSGPSSQCILGSGAGIVARGGVRTSDELFFGGAYEIAKHDPHELYRLATLQQIRAEGRRYFPTGRDAVPFLLFALGVAGYGNELTIETFGPTATAGVGLEIQLGGPVLVCSLAYRPMLFQAWTDRSMPRHDAGVAHFLAIEIGLEAQDRM